MMRIFTALSRSAPSLFVFCLAVALTAGLWAETSSANSSSASAGALVQQQGSQEKAQEKAGEKKKPQKPQQEGKAAQSAAKPSLFELAQKTRQQRQQSETPVLVYTNSVIQQSQGGFVGKTQAPPQPQAEGEQGQGQAQGEAGQEEADPDAELQRLTGDIKAARLDYVTAVNQHQVLQLSINETRNRYLRESNVATQQKWQADLAQQSQELAELERTIQSARARIQQLSRQAGQAGMQPGQLRDLVGELPEPKRIVNQ